MAERRAFVCGHPVKHSRSPLIHGYWLKTLGISGSYERIDILPADIRDFISNLRTSGFEGGNVTIPHKEVAFETADRRDADAVAIGAVNTLWIENGLICGGNTDAIGFAANLDDRAPGWRGRDRALVLGAGGAARAVVHALLSAGYERVDVTNRTPGRAVELAEVFGPQVAAHGTDAVAGLLPGADLVVNTTSLGMDGDSSLPADVELLPSHALVTDIVYVPLETPFLRAAAARGLVTVGGLGMLLHQAVPGFERWFGQRPVVTAQLRDIVVADLEAHT